MSLFLYFLAMEARAPGPWEYGEFRPKHKDNLSSGKYRVSFDASGLAGGVYFYCLQAGDFTATRKMILMR